MTAHELTVLKPHGPGLARKHIYADGTIRDADNIKRFRHSTEDISTPAKLLEAIQRLSSENVLVIRGAAACDRQPLIRRKAHDRARGDEGFIETPRAWMALDIDGLKLPAMTDWREDPDAVIEHAVGLLPECFHDATIVWQFTGTHGLERAADRRWTGNYVGDVVRLRLWVLLDRAIDESLAVAWTRSMSGPLALDPAVSRTVQMIYVARPTTEAGTDPLQPLIDRGTPVVGLRQGLEDYVVVPDNIETEARWARAEGRTMQCAAHPSAAAAVAAIGTPTRSEGRGEIRSHLWSAASHLIRAERQAGREPSVTAVEAALTQMVLDSRPAIEGNLSAYGRSWVDVLGYLDPRELRFIAWLLSQPADTRGADGGGKRKRVQRIQVATAKADPTIHVLSVEQIHDKAISEITAFVQASKDYWTRAAELIPDEPGQPLALPPIAPRRMLAVSTGGGKTRAGIDGGVDFLQYERAAGGTKAAYYLAPHHRLCDELSARVAAQGEARGSAVKTIVWRGMKQPDPLDPSVQMCRRPEDLKIVEKYGLPVGETLCLSNKGGKLTACPMADVCGYRRQAAEAIDADVVVATHDLLQAKPAALPEPGIGFVDEAAWGKTLGGIDTPVKITATALRKKDKSMPDLDWAKRDLADLLDGPTPEPDGGIAAERLQGLAVSMTAMGLSPAKAAALEWTRAGKLKATVVKLSGSDLETALKRELGDAAGVKTARQMASLWRAVDDASALPPGSRSGRLEIHTPKGADAPREIRIRWKEDLAAAWGSVPIMFMDATADAAVLGACFDGIEPSPRYVAHSPHVRIRQVVDRALSHAAIAPKTPEELVDASPSQRVNALTARANAKKVKARLISDALNRYLGQPVVAVVPAATERVWREDVIPSWLTILHHGAITGLDAHKSCRAVYNVGRPLPSSAAVEAMAGAITGIEPSQKGYRETRRELVCADGSGVVVTAWEHPDPLCEAFRRQVTEAGIVQSAGRGRGLLRTADDPLDIILWTDVAVPELGLVEAETWEGPSVEDEMLAAGCWVELVADAARVHPEIVGTPGSLKKARQRMTRDISLYGSLLSKCPWSYRYRPAAGGRSTIGTAVFLNDVPETEARAFLEARLGPLALLARVQPPEIAEAPQKALEAAPEAIELPAPLSAAPEVFDLSSYRGGIMPPAVVAQARALQAALGLTQEAMAELVGVSRPHLANAQAGRYPLSEAAALRLVTLLMAPPPVRQPDLFAFH